MSDRIPDASLCVRTHDDVPRERICVAIVPNLNVGICSSYTFDLKRRCTGRKTTGGMSSALLLGTERNTCLQSSSWPCEYNVTSYFVGENSTVTIDSRGTRNASSKFPVSVFLRSTITSQFPLLTKVTEQVCFTI